MPPPPRALIIGAGVAGSTLAFWLAQANMHATIIERSHHSFRSGQGIDVEGPAREVARRMGVEEEILARTTGEQGFAILDDSGKMLASVEGIVTRSVEILRGDLVDVLVGAAGGLENVEIRFGVSIKEIRQDDGGVVATFSDGREERFDFVIGADGSRSKTRQLVFDKEENEMALRPIGVYCSFFQIPRQQEDWPYGRVQHAVGNRSVVVRPAHANTSAAYASLATESQALYEAFQTGDRQVQKRAIGELFGDVGGIAPRVMKQMMNSKDFYFERLAQVKLSSWSRGRVALVGDAAYSPTPLTGAGTNLALVGAYVLAGEMSKSPEDPAAAFKAYEDRLKEFVEKSQTIALGGRAPQLFNPATAWGIWVLRTLFRFIAWTGLWKLFNIAEPQAFELPEYPAFVSS
ncbi:oxidoreductase [Polyplosphaeria fusca]|uniref:Oxidoreductase n=1 Tax=Polyplosphaeria fusca TaxID=682080 RepID=A0A9P4QYL9_9PLEO|nr:oxidoreductase [Polyplosphaeria fusca]